jgi:hypothetical protein
MIGRCLVFISLLVSTTTGVFATHLRAGEISVWRVPGTLTVYVTLQIYTNTIDTRTRVGGDVDYIDFGDCTHMLVPETENTLRPDLGFGVAMVSFTTTHTYAVPGQYVISYSEPNRNAGIANMDNSVNTRFYLESRMSVDSSFGDDYSSPVPLSESVFQVSNLTDIRLSTACVDSSDYKLFYTAVTPMRGKRFPVTNYRYPENYKVNLYNGEITWNRKVGNSFREGEYSFAIKISQVNNQGYEVGYMIRDFQIIVEDEDVDLLINDNIDLDENGRIFLPSDSSTDLTVTALCLSCHGISMKVLPGFDQGNGAINSTYDSTRTMSSLTIHLATNNSMVRQTPYAIVVRVFGYHQASHGSGLFRNDVSYLLYTTNNELTLPANINHKKSPITCGVNIIPNPVVEEFAIDLQEEGSASVDIYDATGKAMFHLEPNAEGFYDVRDLPLGIYYAKMKFGEGKAVTRKIKKLKPLGL